MCQNLFVVCAGAYAGACACACAVIVTSLLFNYCFVRWARFSWVLFNYGRVAAVLPRQLTRLLSSLQHVCNKSQVKSIIVKLLQLHLEGQQDCCHAYSKFVQHSVEFSWLWSSCCSSTSTVNKTVVKLTGELVLSVKVLWEMDRGRTRVTLITSKAIFVTYPRHSLGFVWVSAIMALGPFPCHFDLIQLIESYRV